MVVRLVHLDCFVHLVSFVQPNKRDNPDEPNNGLLMLADFFSILVETLLLTPPTVNCFCCAIPTLFMTVRREVARDKREERDSRNV